MSRMLKVPSAIAEYTVGTVIVLFHLSVLRPLEERARRRSNDAPRPGQPRPAARPS